MFSFEKLNVYQDSKRIIKILYKTSQNWPKSEQYGLSDQIRRAAVSIGLNIAEGTSRTKKDFAHFLDLSRGSCLECVAILDIAESIGYIKTEERIKLFTDLENLYKRLSALKLSVFTNHCEQ